MSKNTLRMSEISAMIKNKTKIQLDGIVQTVDTTHRILRLDMDANRLVLGDLMSGLELRIDWEYIDMDHCYYYPDINEGLLQIQRY